MAVEHFNPDVDGDENLVQIAALTPTDNAVIIGNGSAWTAESGATLRTSLGLAIGSDVQAYDADLAAWAGVNPSSYLTTAAAAAAYQPLDTDLTSWAAVTRASGFDTFAGTPTSANLRALLSDESGSGALLFAGGALGTPASGVLTNCTGLPNASVVGLGTAALVNTGISGATIPLLNGANTWGATQIFQRSGGNFQFLIDNGANTKQITSWFSSSDDQWNLHPSSASTLVSNKALNYNFTSALWNIGSDPIMTRGAAETITGAKVASGIWQFGSQAAQSNALLSNRARVNAFEWGHPNTAGYSATLGMENGSGRPNIVFSGEGGTDNSTYRTRGIKASIIASDLAGGLQFGTVGNANADNQTMIVLFDSDVNGAVRIGTPTGGFKGAGTLNATAVYDDNTLLTCYIVEAWKYGKIDLAKWDAIAPNREHPARYETIETGEMDADRKPVTEQRLIKEAYTEVREHAPARGFAKVAADRLDIDKFAQFVWDNERLPAFPAPDRWADMYAGKMATGDLIQRLWETVEVMAIHSIEARKREVVLTSRLAALEASQ